MPGRSWGFFYVISPSRIQRRSSSMILREWQASKAQLHYSVYGVGDGNRTVSFSGIPGCMGERSCAGKMTRVKKIANVRNLRLAYKVPGGNTLQALCVAPLFPRYLSLRRKASASGLKFKKGNEREK